MWTNHYPENKYKSFHGTEKWLTTAWSKAKQGCTSSADCKLNTKLQNEPKYWLLGRSQYTSHQATHCSLFFFFEVAISVNSKSKLQVTSYLIRLPF